MRVNTVFPLKLFGKEVQGLEAGALVTDRNSNPGSITF